MFDTFVLLVHHNNGVGNNDIRINAAESGKNGVSAVSWEPEEL